MLEVRSATVRHSRGNVVATSDSGWAACDACCALIVTGNRAGLLERGAQLIPEIPELRHWLQVAHQAFFDHQLPGPPVRIEAAPVGQDDSLRGFSLTTNSLNQSREEAHADDTFLWDGRGIVRDPRSMDMSPEARPCPLNELIVVTAQVGDEYRDTGRDVETHILPLMRSNRIRYVQVRAAGILRPPVSPYSTIRASRKKCFSTETTSSRTN